MILKIRKLYPLLLILITFNSMAQTRLNQKKEQIKSLKIAHITSELQLTSEEATKFWPLYNAFEEKQKTSRQDKIRSYMERQDNSELDKMTEKEAITLLNQMESTEEEMYLLRKKFVANLKTILPSIKIIKLKKAEDGFNRKLLKQFRAKMKE